MLISHVYYQKIILKNFAFENSTYFIFNCFRAIIGRIHFFLSEFGHLCVFFSPKESFFVQINNFCIKFLFSAFMGDRRRQAYFKPEGRVYFVVFPFFRCRLSSKEGRGSAEDRPSSRL